MTKLVLSKSVWMGALSIKGFSEHIFCNLVSPIYSVSHGKHTLMQVFYGGEVKVLLDFNLENGVLLNEDFIVRECGGELFYELVSGSFSDISLSDVIIDAVLAVIAFYHIYRCKTHII